MIEFHCACIFMRPDEFTPSTLVEPCAFHAPLTEEAERYRWFRDKCDQDRRIEILEASEGIADLIDHHIDKGRVGL